MNEALRQYAETRSPEAFRQVVGEHIDAVFSQCRRHLRDADRAQDATQLVFVTLARRARELPPDVRLSGWLFNTARYVCSREQRTERRRLARERRAAEMRRETVEQTSAASDDVSAEAELLLDDALAKLSEHDRAVILCRFFEGKSLRDVGMLLGVSEDAAKQRVWRAIEKLRKYFARKGLAVHSAVVTASLSAAVQPASAGLLDSIVSAAISKTSPIHPLPGKSRIAVSAAKATAAALAITGMIAAGVVVAKLAPAANRVAATLAVAPAPPATTPSSEPLDQSTPLNTLRKLSAAIRRDNPDDIDACILYTGLANPKVGNGLRTCFLFNAATCRVEQAWAGAFKRSMEIEGFEFDGFPGLHGGFEELFDRTVSGTKPGDVIIHGQIATVRVRVPREKMVEFGQGAWASALLVMRRQGDQWLLDASSSIELKIDLEPKQPDTQATFLRANTEAVAILHEAAEAIKNGQLRTPKQAGDQILADLLKSLHELKLTDMEVNTLPRNAG